MNVELLEKTLEAIKDAHRKWLASEDMRVRWNQKDWFILPQMPWNEMEAALAVPSTLENIPCGTACCFAGFAVLVDGRSKVRPACREALLENESLGWPQEPVRTRAWRLLDLDTHAGWLAASWPDDVVDDEAMWVLFGANNDIADLEERVQELLEHREEPYSLAEYRAEHPLPADDEDDDELEDVDLHDGEIEQGENV